MKQKLKKLTALLLSILMVTSYLTDLLPARAAEESGGTPEPAADMDVNFDAGSPETGLPNLFIDFLGDNNLYAAAGTPGLGSPAIPADRNQATTGNGGVGTWPGYTDLTAAPGTIFWVGVGVDRMNVLDLFRQSNTGVYSAELGFYYNSKFVEPYTGSTSLDPAEYNAAYKTVIENANITNSSDYPHSWQSEYSILRALTGLDPQAEPVTQETLRKESTGNPTDAPTMDDIMGTGLPEGETNPWKMTYVSLQKNQDSVAENRFARLYDGKLHPAEDPEHPDVPDTAENEPTKYLLLIPFVLKAYDQKQALCLRMVRNPSHCTVGGGPDGAEPYAAWERVTVRNRDRELKLMTNFQGDLNIFTGARTPDKPYEAKLVLENGGSTGNTAALSITDDPSPDPVKATKNEEVITGLYGGTGMTLDVTCAEKFDVAVTVTTGEDATENIATFTTVAEKKHYTFLMPESNVVVTVKFSPNGNPDYWVYLDEDRSADDTADDPAVRGNGTAIFITAPETIVVDRDSDTQNVDGKILPGGVAARDKDITIEVKVRADYYAEVALYIWGKGANKPPDVTVPSLVEADANNKVTLPAGGTLTLGMPDSDVFVRVKYLPAAQHKAALEIYHDAGADVLPGNVAQLGAAVYTDANTPMPGYSSVVYHDHDGTTNPAGENHSAIETNFRVLERVDASSAANSGSLGGDGGKLAAGWKDGAGSFMALAYTAANSTAALSALTGKLTPYDLRNVPDVKAPGVNGLRKNAVGDYYADSDLSAFFARLYDIAKLAKASGAAYQKDVTDPADSSKVLYSYYDLTPQQVQMYLLDYEQYEKALAAAGESVPTAPVLRTAADAASELTNADAWFVPSKDTKPPTAPDHTAPKTGEAFLETRSGRAVSLVLEADSAYEVKSIVLHDPRSDAATPDPAAKADVAVTNRSADYQNEYTFTMPDYDCAVRVTYAKREVSRLNLAITGAGNQAANAIALTGYTPSTPSGAASTAVTLNSHGSNIPNVFVGSIVSVKANKKTGFQVSATVKRAAGGVSVPTTPAGITNMADGTLFTFRMPNETADVAITYTKESVPANNAYIIAESEGAIDGSTAFWAGTSLHSLSGVSEGAALAADVTVAPGSYIHSAEVYTAAGAYLYTLSGNGYNNGLGGRVTLNTVMPNADVYIKLVFRDGPPPEEPELPLTLKVADPHNVGTGTPPVYADNWASAGITGGVAATLGPVGKGTTGKGTLSDMEYVHAGDEVTVEFHNVTVMKEGRLDPENSYYVKSVEVQPASLGAAVEWIDTTHAKFVMPAGASAVVVTYAKGKAPTWFMDVDKTERGGDSQADNTVKQFTSPTIVTNVSPLTHYAVPQPTAEAPWPVRVPTSEAGYGAAAAGETVTVDVAVCAGWHIDSLTVTGGGQRLRYTITDAPGGAVVTDGGYKGGAGGTVYASFPMPNGDVSLTVNYLAGEPPAIKDYQIELAVTDPDNVDDGTTDWSAADNHASAALTGSTVGNIGPLGVTRTANGMRGVAYAKPGDTVTIDYTAAAGFALDIIIVTPTGLKIVPTYLGGSRASFVMPADSVTAEVRFKRGAAQEYTADLILRMPAGVAPAGYDQVGEGTFGTDLTAKQYSVKAAPGEKLDLGLLARDGYYIRGITVTPAALGVDASLSGSFGRQSGAFTMPAANVTVNVWFEKLWPDQVKYDLNLEVFDGDVSGGSAHFGSIAGKLLTPPDSDTVIGGKKKTLAKAAYDRDSVFVALSPAAGYYVGEVLVVDDRGMEVSWTYAPGGVQFTMPPSHATVSVRFEKGTAATYKAEFHAAYDHSGTGLASLSYGTNTIWAPVDTEITNIPVGGTLTVSTQPNAPSIVTAAYAVNSATGEQLIIPMDQVTGGASSQFAMPAADVEVYVAFDKRDLQPTDLAATLQVSGPAGAGEAVLTAATDPAASSDVVRVGESGILFAPRDTLLTVDLTTAADYNLSSVRVISGGGADVPYRWTDATQRHFTFEMPVDGAGVHVALEDVRSARADLTAQVVVNDEAYTGTSASRSAALLRKGGEATGGQLVTALKAGDPVYLDLAVQPGFVVESILVVPAKYGIAPSLTLKPGKDQSTSFLMPADDVVVYVRFAADGRDRRKVTLAVTGTPGVSGNAAYIESDFSGRKGPTVTGSSQWVMAGYPDRESGESAEWVKVDYDWAAGNSVKSITVEDDQRRSVPFTQVDDKHIIFPMVNGQVTVIINYQNTPQPTKYDAVLHVIDLDEGNPNAGSTGTLTWGADTAGPLGAYPAADDAVKRLKLQAPAGQDVTVDAAAGPGSYIKAAYVLYEDGGQMIRCNLPAAEPPAAGYPSPAQSTFKMHPGRNDVYVYYTRTAPVVTEYAAALFLDGVDTDDESKAVLGHSAGDNTAVVQVNGPHGYVTAAAAETMTVTVIPVEGYAIDTILFTPLGIGMEQGGSVDYTRTGNTFTFPMPAENIAVRVVLKEAGAAEYTATLHYLMAGDPPTATDPDADWASISYLSADGNLIGTKVNGDSLIIPESMKVDLAVSMDAPNLVLAAYVLRGGALVPLDKALEGAAEGASNPDDTLADDKATFTMPGSDVDVFIWFTDAKPHNDWRTAILTVTDDNGKGVLNSGNNYADIRSDVNNTGAVQVFSHGVPSHAYLTVEQGEAVTVTVTQPQPGYDFRRPATISHSPTSTLGLTEGGSAPNYAYTYHVGAFNSGVSVHYKGTVVSQNPLGVLAVDADNPGDETVTNTVSVSPGTMTPLTLLSTTAAGARQTIPGVQENTAVSFTVTPESSEYLPVASLVTGSGAAAAIKSLPLTESGGVYTGTAFSMPSKEATLVVTFYKRYSATLSLVHAGTVPDTSSQAAMTESAFNGSVTADIGGDGVFSDLPVGALLSAHMDRQAGGTRLLGALFTEKGSTTVIAPTAVTDGPDEYRHALSRADGLIQMVVATDDNTTSYLAAVAAEKLPAGCRAPAITASTPTAAKGDGWTAAEVGDTVTVKVTVPTGYRADLSATGGAVLSGAALTADGSVTFPMPASHVQVTVTYTKTALSATLVVRESAGGSAKLSTLTDSGTLTGLKAGDELPYTATANAGSEIAAVVLTTAGGTTSHLTPEAAGRITMPADDVTLTVVFGAEPVEPTDPKDRLYIASVNTADTGGLPDNRAVNIINTIDGTLAHGALWAGGYQGHGMLVSFTTQPGYTAVVKASTPGGTDVTVIQQGTTLAGAAYLDMPADDVVVTITYYSSDHPPVLTGHDLTLKLVGHGGEAENKAELSSEGTSLITLNGTEQAPGGDKADPVSKKAAVKPRLGVDLDLSADWKSDYTVVRATIEVGGVEAELDLSRYGTNATSLFFMPDSDATVTVYYARIYTATLQIAGADTAAGDGVSMTDDREDTVPVSNSGDQLTDLLGDAAEKKGETIMTTAAPGTDRELVGVLYAANTTGAHTVKPPTSLDPPDTDDRYDFTMPQEDVTVTAVFQKRGDGYHIAKVALDPAGDNGVAGNKVSIADKGDAKALSGPFWTTAKEGAGITVTITLATGYQAVITSAVGDGTGDDLYVNRVNFNAGTADMTGVFTMPNEDATVTVKFIKGYTATLGLTDLSKLNEGSGATIAAGGTTITGTSDGADPASITYTDDALPPNAVDHVSELDDGAQIDYTATPGAGVTARIVRTTANTGTTRLDDPEDPAKPLKIAGEDVTVGVILRSTADPIDLLAKVERAGESDIVGNRAQIADTQPPDPNGTVTGNVWTTTQEAHEITVTVNVAKGYVALVTAKQDRDDAPLTNLSTDSGATTSARVSIAYVDGGDPNIGADQTLTFEMPAATDVTVTVEYQNAGTIPAPYDPVRTAHGNLDRGYIYGENRGGHAVITIPTLVDAEDPDALYSADRYKDTDPDTAVGFRFYLYDKAADIYTELKQGTDMLLAPVDPNNTSTPYDYGNYYTKPAAGAKPEVRYTGARFALSPLGTGASAVKLGKILNNDGTMVDGDTVLYVQAENARNERSAYVQAVILPYYELTGSFISYAPTHEAIAGLYALKDGMDPAAVDLTDPANYDLTEPFAVDKVAEESGTGLWKQDFSIKSSELLGGTYLLRLEKPGHITYTRVDIALTEVNLPAPESKTFAITDEISLIPGDVTGDGRINLRDRDLVMDYLAGSGTGDWTRATDDTQPGWSTSIYNPATEAYRCDLDGNGNINARDRDIVMDYMNWSGEQYKVGGALPSGLSAAATFELLEELVEEDVPDVPPAPEEPVIPAEPVIPEEPAEPPTEPEIPEIDVPDVSNPEVPHAGPDDPIGPPAAPPPPEEEEEDTAQPPEAK